MGVETILFVFLFIIGIAVTVMVAKARRRVARGVKTPREKSTSGPGAGRS